MLYILGSVRLNTPLYACQAWDAPEWLEKDPIKVVRFATASNFFV